MAIFLDVIDRVAFSEYGARQYPAKEILMRGAFLSQKDLHIKDFPAIPENLGLILPNCAVLTGHLLMAGLTDNEWIGIYHPLMNCIVVIATWIKDLKEGDILTLGETITPAFVTVAGMDEQVDGGEGF